jgi:hypothetical protein
MRVCISIKLLFKKIHCRGQAWWLMLIIPVIWETGQEDYNSRQAWAKC